MKSIHILAIAVSTVFATQAVADSVFPARLQAAQSAVQSPAGATYDKIIEPELDGISKICAQQHSQNLTPSEIVAEVAANGTVSKIAFRPINQFGFCIRSALDKMTLPAPPADQWPIFLQVNLITPQ